MHKLSKTLTSINNCLLLSELVIQGLVESFTEPLTIFNHFLKCPLTLLHQFIVFPDLHIFLFYIKLHFLFLSFQLRYLLINVCHGHPIFHHFSCYFIPLSLKLYDFYLQIAKKVIVVH